MIENKRSKCPITCTLDLLGDKWSLLIIRDILFMKKRYYCQFIDSPESISTNILANRLVKLEASHIITKKRDENDKKKFIYSPTKKALALIPVLVEMIKWSHSFNKETILDIKELNEVVNNTETYTQRLIKDFHL